MRYKGNVCDSLIITKDEDYVIRRLALSEYGVLSVLEEPIKEPINDINIKLFEGDNYIYLLDMSGNRFYAEYLIKNDFNNVYITRSEAHSAINETARAIELNVNEKLTEYSTTEEMEAAIKIEADKITNTVSKKVGKDEFATYIEQNAEAIRIAWNKISQYLKLEGINGKALLNIYDQNNKLLMSLSDSGQNFLFEGNNVGFIGTTFSDGNKSSRGLVFNLENKSNFMAWTFKDKETDSEYNVKFGYWKELNALKLGCDMLTNNNCIVISPGHSKEIGIGNNNITRLTDDKIILGFTTNNILNCYNDLDMQGWSINNANNIIKTNVISSINMPTYASDRSRIDLDFVTKGDGTFRVQINTSDGRLKKDIENSNINALDIINQIRHRQFNWKSNNAFQEIGYIAQELEEINEDFVAKVPQTDEEGNIIDYLYQINDIGIQPYITKAIQELYAKQQEHTEEINKQNEFLKLIAEKINLQEEYNNIFNKSNKIKSKKRNEKVCFNDEIKLTKVKKIEKIEKKAPFMQSENIGLVYKEREGKVKEKN